MAVPTPLQEPPDLSLVLGRAALSNALAGALDRSGAGVLRRRIVISVLLCWVPLAVLSLGKLTFWAEQSFPFFVI